jgi:hypothetical protein
LTQPRTIGLMIAANSSSVRSLRRLRRHALIVVVIALQAVRLTAGEKLTNRWPVLLTDSLGRKVYPRKSNCRCSCELSRFESLQYTRQVLSGCNSRPHSANLRAMRSLTNRACRSLVQCTTTSSQYRSDITAGDSRPIQASKA